MRSGDCITVGGQQAATLETCIQVNLSDKTPRVHLGDSEMYIAKRAGSGLAESLIFDLL